MNELKKHEQELEKQWQEKKVENERGTTEGLGTGYEEERR